MRLSNRRRNLEKHSVNLASIRKLRGDRVDEIRRQAICVMLFGRRVRTAFVKIVALISQWSMQLVTQLDDVM